MLKLYIATLSCALAVTAVDAGTLDRPAYEQVDKITRKICQDGAKRGCWRPLEEVLQRLSPPSDQRQWEDYFFGHFALAQCAYWVGDFDESAHFFEKVLEIAPRIGQGEDGHSNFAVLLANREAAAPALSMGNYTLALAYLDLALAQPASKEFKEELAVMRAGSLAGLHRVAETRLALDRIVATLRWDGHAPGEAFPFAPEPMNPYEIARRAAAFYFRQGDAAASLKLLERVEAARRATIEGMPKDLVPGGYWAQRLQPGILLLDMATVHEQQGRQEAAAQLKREAAALRKASAEPTATGWHRPDPLSRVLGLLN
jgi:tetratricopeptide (TPR) repeat protein